LVSAVASRRPPGRPTPGRCKRLFRSEPGTRRRRGHVGAAEARLDRDPALAAGRHERVRIPMADGWLTSRKRVATRTHDRVHQRDDLWGKFKDFRTWFAWPPSGGRRRSCRYAPDGLPARGWPASDRRGQRTSQAGGRPAQLALGGRRKMATRPCTEWAQSDDRGPPQRPKGRRVRAREADPPTPANKLWPADRRRDWAAVSTQGTASHGGLVEPERVAVPETGAKPSPTPQRGPRWAHLVGAPASSEPERRPSPHGPGFGAGTVGGERAGLTVDRVSSRVVGGG